MSIKPILFNTEMVRAILDGRKTVTRRLPSRRVEEKWWEYDEWASDTCAGFARDGIPCDRTYEKEFYEQYPPYMPGDILYVRETWNLNNLREEGNTFELGFIYKAIKGSLEDSFRWVKVPETIYDKYADSMAESNFEGWRPSIHMPKEAARIWLKVMDVRVERLQDITTEEALKEGCTGEPCNHVNQGAFGCTDCYNTGWLYPPKAEFMELWNSTIQKQDLNQYGWDANPWVWVIEFERCEKPEEVEDE